MRLWRWRHQPYRQKNISGIVRDGKTGEPVIGSVVEIKELPGQRTTTGLDGTFAFKSLPSDKSLTLVVSYISYKTREIKVDAAVIGERMDIQMEEDAKQLGVVVVTGFKSSDNDRCAIDFEKNSRNVVNVVSQQSIQLSPDVNVAGVLTRVSGVVMERCIGTGILRNTSWNGQAVQLYTCQWRENSKSR